LVRAWYLTQSIPVPWNIVIEQLNQLPYSRFVAVEEFISFFQRSELLLQLQLYLGHFFDVLACAPAPHSFQSKILFQPFVQPIFQWPFQVS
jgi:hypothetical protein